MRLVLLCGLTAERDIVKAGPGTILCGAHARDSLASLVPSSCTGLVSWGCAGALAGDLAIGSLTVARSVTTMDGSVYPSDMAWSRAIAVKTGAQSRPFFSAPTEQAATVAARAALHDRWHVDVVDEETWAVAILAKARNIPWVGIRSISDTAAESLPAAAADPLATNPDGSTDLGEVFGDILRDHDPAEVGGLITDGEDFQRAMDTLRTAYEAIGADFGFPS